MEARAFLKQYECQMSVAWNEKRRNWPAIGSVPRGEYLFPDTVEEDLQAWWRHLIDSNINWHTVKANWAATRRCVKLLMDVGLNYEALAVDTKEIRFLREVGFAGLSPDTVKWYIMLFGRYLRFNGNSVIDGMELHWQNSDVHPGKDWLEREQAAVLMACDGYTVHERTALVLMLTMGLRRIEVLRLRVDGITDDGVIVCGKGHGGGKYRFVPYSKGARLQIQEMLRWREMQISDERDLDPDYEPDPELFLTQTRHPHHYNEAGTGFDKSILKGIREKSGVEFSNHTLRRTFARLTYFENPTERTLEILASILGHEDTKVTLRYIGVSEDEKSDVMLSQSWF